MIQRLRQRAQSQEGFTLIELLVVILIIGILAAVAIPAFLNQKGKANDATAKADATTAQTAEETYFTDNQTYIGAAAGKTALVAIEPALNQAFSAVAAPTNGDAMAVDAPAVAQFGATAGASATTSFDVVTTSKSTVQYQITRNDNGTVSRTCQVASASVNPGGCRLAAAPVYPNANGTW